MPETPSTTALQEARYNHHAAERARDAAALALADAQERLVDAAAALNAAHAQYNEAADRWDVALSYARRVGEAACV